MSRNPKFDALLDRLKTIHDAKNHDYASDDDPLSNFKAAARLGVEPWKAILIRMSDKWSRLEQLLGTGKRPKNESINDTLDDLIIYGCLARILRDEDADSAPAGSGSRP